MEEQEEKYRTPKNGSEIRDYLQHARPHHIRGKGIYGMRGFGMWVENWVQFVGEALYDRQGVLRAIASAMIGCWERRADGRGLVCTEGAKPRKGLACRVIYVEMETSNEIKDLKGGKSSTLPLFCAKGAMGSHPELLVTKGR